MSRSPLPAGSSRSVLSAALLGLVLWCPAAAASAASGPLASLRAAAPAAGDVHAKATRDALEAAAAADRETAALVQRREDLRAEAANAPARTRALNAQLAVDRQLSLQEWRARLPDTADVETLERALEQERVVADQLRAQLKAINSELATALSQPTASSVQQSELQRRLQELSIPVVAAQGEPAALTEARRARQAAEARQLAADLEYRQAVQDLASSRQRLQELELRALRHRLALREPRVAELQQRIATLGREQLAALAAGLAERAALPARDPVVRTAAQENSALGEELVQTNERLASQRRELASEAEALERDLAGLRDSRTRLELGGRSEQVGTWLWAEMRRLEPERRLEDRLEEVREQLGERRLRLISLSEIERGLADIRGTARALRAQAPGREEDSPEASEGGSPALEDLLEERAGLVERLEPLIWRHIAALEQSERDLQARLDANRELRQTMSRHLLWIRSHPRVDLAWFSMIPAGLHDLVKPSRFVTTGELMQRAIAEKPGGYLASVLLVALLFLMQRRARPRLEQLAQSVREVRKDRYGRTLESLLWTLLAALPWAVAVALLGVLLQDVGTAGKYSDSLGRACLTLAMPVFTLNFLRWLVRERGLAHAHFRWSRPRREALQRWLPRLTLGLWPLYFIVSLAFIRDQELAISVLARLAIVFASLLSAWALWSLLAPDRLWHTRGASTEPSAMRRALRALLPAGMLVCALLALDGYVYSTAIVIDAQLASVGVITAVAVLHGLLTRWFALGERRLALKRLDQRRETEARERAEGATAPEDGGEAVPVELDAELALDKVNEQSRRLLRAFKLTLVVVGLAWVWADVLPAFARFDDVVLWRITEKTAEGVASLVPVTLMAVMLGALALALTFVAARNLPGLLEIGLLSRTGIDAASRYAITSVARYTIVLVGVVVGLNLLGLRWSQLQWMAAALTVGLGFGLQEIFANFVSGLILLFERPFRVGDVITVNNMDGTVTRIRTRATTILDFDNKEIVVPNKAFITGQLVNWTLSDNTTRIVIKLSTDYDADVPTVLKLMLQAAAENPRVLKDWAPRAWLLGLGATSLDFELRVFVGSMSDRLAVRNELNSRIVELFAANEVQFTSPQVAVNVRGAERNAATDAAVSAAAVAALPRGPDRS